MRDTIARQSDVEKSSVKMEIEPGNHKYRIGIISFAAKKGKSVDLEKIHEAIKATRLGGKTRSEVKYLEITAEGEITSTDRETQLNVNGTNLQFVLSDDRSAKPKKGAQTPLERLREALSKGEKVVSVTGRVQGWTGLWPEVLREFPPQPGEKAKEQDKPASKKQPVLVVKDFQIAGK